MVGQVQAKKDAARARWFPALTPESDDLLHLDYLRIIAGGERDQAKIIAKLKTDNGITGKELGASLKTATDAASVASKTCAGL